MSIEEAIKNLNIMLDSAQRRTRRNIVIPDLIEAIEMAIEALKEQRPHGEWKEFTVSTYRGTDDWGEPKWGKGKKCICSRCGRRTVIRENFCPSCGSDNRKRGEHND